MRVNEAVKMRILELCQQNNITLNKLSTICGITQSTLNNIVSGRNATTTVSTIQKICDGLNITIVDFFSSPIFDHLEQEIK
ncbi:MAG: helix-turn-helix transcriptional regulator [Clostridia bacterium]|nr:helix-turn-helix transcriptional regulator [Clostridia bacterium]